MKNVNVFKEVGLVLCLGLLVSDLAQARDLVAASNSAVSVVKGVAQALAVLGIISGGIVMQLPGAGQFGKGILVAGIVGTLCAFGGQSFISLMQTVFGGM